MIKQETLGKLFSLLCGLGISFFCIYQGIIISSILFVLGFTASFLADFFIKPHWDENTDKYKIRLLRFLNIASILISLVNIVLFLGLLYFHILPLAWLYIANIIAFSCMALKGIVVSLDEVWIRFKIKKESKNLTVENVTNEIEERARLEIEQWEKNPKKDLLTSKIDYTRIYKENWNPIIIESSNHILSIIFQKDFSAIAKDFNLTLTTEEIEILREEITSTYEKLSQDLENAIKTFKLKIQVILRSSHEKEEKIKSWELWAKINIEKILSSEHLQWFIEHIYKVLQQEEDINPELIRRLIQYVKPAFFDFEIFYSEDKDYSQKQYLSQNHVSYAVAIRENIMVKKEKLALWNKIIQIAILFLKNSMDLDPMLCTLSQQNFVPKKLHFLMFPTEDESNNNTSFRYDKILKLKEDIFNEIIQIYIVFLKDLKTALPTDINTEEDIKRLGQYYSIWEYGRTLHNYNQLISCGGYDLKRYKLLCSYLILLYEAYKEILAIPVLPLIHTERQRVFKSSFLYAAYYVEQLAYILNEGALNYKLDAQILDALIFYIKHYDLDSAVDIINFEPRNANNERNLSKGEKINTLINLVKFADNNADNNNTENIIFFQKIFSLMKECKKMFPFLMRIDVINLVKRFCEQVSRGTDNFVIRKSLITKIEVNELKILFKLLFIPYGSRSVSLRSWKNFLTQARFPLISRIYQQDIHMDYITSYYKGKNVLNRESLVRKASYLHIVYYVKGYLKLSLEVILQKEKFIKNSITEVLDKNNSIKDTNFKNRVTYYITFLGIWDKFATEERMLFKDLKDLVCMLSIAAHFPAVLEDIAVWYSISYHIYPILKNYINKIEDILVNVNLNAVPKDKIEEIKQYLLRLEQEFKKIAPEFFKHMSSSKFFQLDSAGICKKIQVDGALRGLESIINGIIRGKKSLAFKGSFWKKLRSKTHLSPKTIKRQFYHISYVRPGKGGWTM